MQPDASPWDQKIMNRSSLLAVLLLCVGSVLCAEPAWAGDEDLTSSAYLVFDPETGEFVKVQDPNRAKQHRAARDPAAAAGDTAKSGSKLASTLPFAAGGALAVGLLAGAVVLLRKRKRSNP